MDMIESTITKNEYLTSRQVASCEKGDLVKRNLNLLPVWATATFCHPFRISLRIRINKRKMTAILNPVKLSIIFLALYSVLGYRVFVSPLPLGRGLR
jgi:hypothetical protein